MAEQSVSKLKPWLIGGLIVVIGAALIGYVARPETTTTTNRTTNTNKSADSTPSTQDPATDDQAQGDLGQEDQTDDQINNEPVAGEPTSQPGQYLDYSQASFDAHNDATRILFFHASWCPPCNMLERDIEANTIPNDVVIFKVDYDNSQDLRNKHQVTIQTTLVRVDGQGNKLGDYNAYSSPTLQAVIDNLL